VAAKIAVAAPTQAIVVITNGESTKMKESGHHRGRVDEGGDRRGAGHRVRQPDVQRNLGALAGAAEEERQTDRRGAGDGERRRRLEDVHRDGERPDVEVAELAAADGPEVNLVQVTGLQQPLGAVREARPVERTAVMREEEHPTDEAEVADAVGEEGLLARGRVGHLVVPEADEKVGAEPHAFPADEQERQVVPEDENQHREDEQVHVGEEAPVGLVVRHVRSRVQVNEEADAGARGVHPVPRRPREPGVLVDHRLDPRDHFLVTRQVDRVHQHEEGDERTEEADGESRERHQAHRLLAEPLPPDAVHRRAEKRHAEDEGDQLEIVDRKKLPEHFLRTFSSSGDRLRRCARCASDGTWRGR
jgi:hypothetical protein